MISFLFADQEDQFFLLLIGFFVVVIGSAGVVVAVATVINKAAGRPSDDQRGETIAVLGFIALVTVGAIFAFTR